MYSISDFTQFGLCSSILILNGLYLRYLCVFINKVYQMLGVDIKSSRPVLAGGGVRRW